MQNQFPKTAMCTCARGYKVLHSHVQVCKNTNFQVTLVIAEENIMCQARTGQGLVDQSPKACWVSMKPVISLRGRVPVRQCDQ